MEGHTLLITIVAWGIIAVGGYQFITGATRFFQSLGTEGTGADRQQGGMTALGGIGIIAIGAIVQAGALIPAPTF